MLDLAAYLQNVHAVGFSLLRPVGRAAAGCPVGPPDPVALEKALGRVHARLRLFSAAGIALKVREFEKVKLKLAGGACGGYCPAVNAASFMVLPSGDVYPCGSLAAEKAFCMGNIHGSLSGLAIGSARPAKCAACAFASLCEGGCPARLASLPAMDDLDCVMTKAIASLLGNGRASQKSAVAP
jgi:uncharacterized protein